MPLLVYLFELCRMFSMSVPSW